MGRFHPDLTPEQENKALLTGSAIAIVGYGLVSATRYLRRKASDRRVARMVSATMPEVREYEEKLRKHFDGVLEKHREMSQEILDRVDKAVNKNSSEN